MADNSLSHSATGTVKLHTSLPSLHLASKCLMSWEHLPCVHKVQTQAPFPYWTFSRLSDAWWALLFVSEASTYKHEAMRYMGTSVLLPLSPRPPPPPPPVCIALGMYQHFSDNSFHWKNSQLYLTTLILQEQERPNLKYEIFTSPQQNGKLCIQNTLVVTDFTQRPWRQSVVLGLFPLLGIILSLSLDMPFLL